MIKKSIYPKTKRIDDKENVVVTEKLDGSNLVFFKLNEELYIAQRNNIFAYSDIETEKGKLYKGLYQWLQDNGQILLVSLNETSAICGEWLGMGKLSYDVGTFDKRFYMFAKANVNEDMELFNIVYKRDLFIYPFINQDIPNFIGVVPLVAKLNVIPTVDHLDSLYEKYTNKENRNIEGFVINVQNQITKYVRMKNGKLEEHKGY